MISVDAVPATQRDAVEMFYRSQLERDVRLDPTDEPLAAYDAVQGMLLANREVPGLIVLDLQLPAGGGIQMLERLGGSLLLAAKAMDAGIQLLRVHDVAETVQARAVWRGLRDAALTDFAQLP